MDKEYIERKALLKALCENSRSWAHYIDAIFVAEKFPVAADVVEVKHGRWIPFKSEHAGDIQYCSVCDVGCTWQPDYCPNCGAKMDGEN